MQKKIRVPPWETKLLNDFHDDLLRRIQSLSTRTALTVVHLLLGALSLETELHLRYLSLRYSVTNSNNQTFHQLIRGSSVFCEDLPSSFFSRLKMILVKYGLPSIKLDAGTSQKIAVETTGKICTSRLLDKNTGQRRTH